jgi:hypothetical protein
MCSTLHHLRTRCTPSPFVAGTSPQPRVPVRSSVLGFQPSLPPWRLGHVCHKNTLLDEEQILLRNKFSNLPPIRDMSSILTS